MEVNGLFDVEFRILVSCRDAHIYTIKRGYKTGRLCAQLNSQPVGLLRINNNIIIATMDQMLSSFSTKGKNCNIESWFNLNSLLIFLKKLIFSKPIEIKFVCNLLIFVK